MTCLCIVADRSECLMSRAPWVDSDRCECECACHDGMVIDLASDDLDDDEEVAA